MITKKYEEKILLVDDDAKNLQVAMSILKDYNVIYAQSGEKALDLIEKNKFDLILLDIVMPILDGYSVCERIKKIDSYKNVPIIFLTVKDEEKDIVKGFDLGAVDYVTKPFFSQVLLKRVEVHLKLASVMRELKTVNNNLNELVTEQVEELRHKDEIILKQSKINAMGNIIDIISYQWKLPLDKLKLYLQSLNLIVPQDDETFKNTFSKSIDEVNELNKVMEDFQKFFNNSKNKELVNLKVTLDNVLFILKDDLVKQNIKVDFFGSHLLTLPIVYDEIKHIFKKLIQNVVENSKEIGISNKFLNINVVELVTTVNIVFESNIDFMTFKCNRLLDEIPERIDDKSFDLGFYLLKVFVEKNKGEIILEDEVKSKKFTLVFDK